MSEVVIMQTSLFTEGKPCFKSLYNPWTCTLTANIFPGRDHTCKKTAMTAARTYVPDGLPAYGQQHRGARVSLPVLMTGHLKARAKWPELDIFLQLQGMTQIFCQQSKVIILTGYFCVCTRADT